MIGNLNKNQLGTTLVEVLVAITVFSIIVSVATNIFILSSQASRKIIYDQNTQGSLAFIFDNITQELKNSKLESQFLTNLSQSQRCDYQSARSCSYSNQTLVLTDKNGNRVAFFPSQNSVYKQINSQTPQKISSDKLNVTYLNFNIIQGVSYTPTVTVSMEALSKDKNSSPINLQTTITLRDYATGP
jgi:prepilin-type N-terminal cleavage/methylation domain-containing protein